MADDPLDFQAAHDKKHGPDAEFRYRDDMGREWFVFTCSYADEDGRFCFKIWALDHADAERRLALIGGSGTVDGQIFAEVPG